MEERSSVSPRLCALSAISSPQIFTPDQGRTPISESNWACVGWEGPPLCGTTSAEIQAVLELVARLPSLTKLTFHCQACAVTLLPSPASCHPTQGPHHITPVTPVPTVTLPRWSLTYGWDHSCHSLSCRWADPHHLQHPQNQTGGRQGQRLCGYPPVLGSTLKWLLKNSLHVSPVDSGMTVSVEGSSSIHGQPHKGEAFPGNSDESPPHPCPVIPHQGSTALQMAPTQLGTADVFCRFSYAHTHIYSLLLLATESLNIVHHYNIQAWDYMCSWSLGKLSPFGVEENNLQATKYWTVIQGNR